MQKKSINIKVTIIYYNGEVISLSLNVSGFSNGNNANPSKVKGIFNILVYVPPQMH